MEEKKAQKTRTEIVASFSGKISTGRFENSQPLFSVKEEWLGDMSIGDISERQALLHQMCFDKFSEAERTIVVDRVKRQRADFRFYPIGSEYYPSVTSILNWDTDWNVPPAQLQQYASRGTIIHYQVNQFLKTGEWIDPHTEPALHKDVIIVKSGDLHLSWDDVDFRAFYAKFPFKPIETECQVVNHEHRYAGRLDIVTLFDNKPSILDIKTGTVDEDKAFKQMAAYAMAYNSAVKIEQLVVVPLNKNTKQGFSAPKITTDINKYFDAFLVDRRAFKDVFAV